METLLILDGAEIHAAIEVQERPILDLTAGRIDRAELADWLRPHLKPLG